MWVDKNEWETMRARVAELERQLIEMKSATRIYAPKTLAEYYPNNGYIAGHPTSVDVASVVLKLLDHLKLNIEYLPSRAADVSLVSKGGPEKGK